MLKIIGSILMLFGACAVGFAKANELKKTVQFWKDMRHSVLYMQTQIKFCRPEITELITGFVGDGRTPSQKFFNKIISCLENGQPPDESLQFAIRYICKAVSLDSDAERILRSFEKVFSAQDVDDAVTACQNCEENFRYALDLAVNKEKERSRLYKSLGLSGGVFAVILFF